MVVNHQLTVDQRLEVHMRTIALEEHYVTPEFMASEGRWLQPYAQVVDPLLDLGAGRIAAMDAGGVDLAVLSLSAPGVEQLAAEDAVELARSCNDTLAAAVRANPGRLAGFATIPTSAPEQAADELSRAVGQLGFVGAIVNGHSSGRYLDDPFFRPILDRAVTLDVPIYLHPTPPPAAVTDASYAGFSPDVSFSLSTAGWGWHIDTALHVLRLILGGVFDRYPTLQVVVGHMGETLPVMLPRFDQVFAPRTTQLDRPVSDYLRGNVSYTFSGFNQQPTFAILLAQLGIDRIMFSTDYPYGSMATATEFLAGLPLQQSERESIAFRNAEKLLRL
jgi:predicted TIM-barrel fold metal-dependent hydrolase